MTEERAPSTNSSVSVMDQAPAPPSGEDGETLAVQGSIEIKSSTVVQEESESTCHAQSNKEDSGGVSSDAEQEKTLELADELSKRGSEAMKENDYSEAADCFSRALEIRAAHYGELAVECLNAYYQYGRALLYKAQDESDPLGSMPNKETESQHQSTKCVSAENTVNGESSTAVSSNAEQGESSNLQDGVVDAVSDGRNGVGNQDGDEEELAEADEDESDLDMAWKMLDIARAIAEKHDVKTMVKVDILSALAEVSLEREDIESSLSDYHKALSILKGLVEPDSRLLAELNFRICMCLEIGSKPQEAIPYCQKAISICKARLQRLSNEVKSVCGSTTSSTVSEVDEGIQQSNLSQTDKSLADKEAEIEVLSGLAEDLEKRLEDLQQHALNPKSIISEILGMASAKAKASEKLASSAAMSSSRVGIAESNRDLDSPTVSTGHTNGAGVTHLGVVGRGVKRVFMSNGTGDLATKIPKQDSSEREGHTSK